MGLLPLSILAASVLTGVAPTGQPVAKTALASISENFDTLSTGSYTTFPGFGGGATFYAYGSGSIIVDPVALPPRSQPSAIFGNYGPVIISFNQVWKKLDAYFRVPRDDIFALKRLGLPTFAVVEFYRNGSQVGMSVYSIVRQDQYTPFNWDLTELGGFDGVVILGNGGNGDMIGIDDMVASS